MIFFISAHGNPIKFSRFSFRFRPAAVSVGFLSRRRRVKFLCRARDEIECNNIF